MMHAITVLAQLPGDAAANPSPGGIVVVGFLFVITVLGLLAALTSAMGAWFNKQAASSAAKAAAAAQAAAETIANGGSASASASPGAAAPSKHEDDPVLIAVIAAAVHTVVGDRSHRVVSIRSAGPGWAQEGRRQIFSSHRVR
jgi:Na+-transporting methylmalonyl-CoA/oxaloacetate decarboxylase gamma subunit